MFDHLSDDEYSYSLHMTGMATTLPADHDDDIVERLRKAIEDATGKPIDRPTKNPIGFVW